MFCYSTVLPECPRGKNNKSVRYKLLEGVSVYQASLASSAMENNDMQMVLDREQTMQTWASYSNNVGSLGKATVHTITWAHLG